MALPRCGQLALRRVHRILRCGDLVRQAGLACRSVGNLTGASNTNQDAQFTVNGSVVGYSGFSAECNFPVEPPQQAVAYLTGDGLGWRTAIPCER